MPAEPPQPVPWEQLIDAMAGLQVLGDLIQSYPRLFTPIDRQHYQALAIRLTRIHDGHPGDDWSKVSPQFPQPPGDNL